uniref:Paired domain-containing protein n=1 Tax=Heliothis virescens TaxID=7102 RepID=A0A2A4JDZ1_HELVI
MAPRLTPAQREHIIMLKSSGCRVIDICRLTGITKNTVGLWLRRWEESGTLQPHYRSQYTRATTAEDDAAIVAAHSANPGLSTRVSSSSYSISMDTVRRRLKEAAKQIEARPSFCLE